MPLDFAAGDWDRAATNAATIGVFFLGAVLASLLRRALQRSYPCLLLAAALLAPIHLVPLTTMEQLLLLAFAMGTQGGSIRHFGSARLQTVVVTGTLLQLADAVVSQGLKARSASSGSGDGTTILALGSWATYGVGAALGITLGRAISLPLAPAIGVLLLTTADLVFLHNRSRPRR